MIMSKKRCFALVSSLVISLVISSVVTTNVHAAVKSYIAKDASGRTISFNLDKLIADYTNNMTGASSPMFDEYMKDAANLIAFEDTVKGYVSYDSVMNAYTNAVIVDGGKTFNLDTVTENASASDIKSITVDYSCENGSVVAAVKATVEQAGTVITGKTVVIASLPSEVDATKYNVTIDGQALAYDATTKKFTVTLDGTFTVQELQNKILVSSKDISNEFDVDNVY
jgi:phage baseplate assembly protein gpV